MKVSNSQKRLLEMMNILDIKQSDIVKKTGIQKSSLSNYISGRRVPRQDQLSLIADPYDINPAWLMGYDVPMYYEDIVKIETIDQEEANLLLMYRDMSKDSKKQFVDYGIFLSNRDIREHRNDD